MFINLGNGIVILAEDIIAILDYELFTNSVIMEAYEEKARKEKKLKGSNKDVKSVIITTNQIYLSSLSVMTLRKRASIEATISHLDDYSDDLIDE